MSRLCLPHSKTDILFFAGLIALSYFGRTEPMKILVTGSSGLIGSEAVAHFDGQGHEIVGVDNNMRRVFFGAA